jgi:cobalt-zinc-cadmium efflux system outer membrane protein
MNGNFAKEYGSEGLGRDRPAGVKLAIGVLLAFNLSASAQIDSAANQRILDTQLQQLLLETISANPSLKAAGNKVIAAAASATAKRALDPPQVGVDFFQAPVRSFPNPFKDQMEVDYFLQQTLPFPGKLSAISGAERKRAEMLAADSQALAEDLTRSVKDGYYELYFVDRRMELLRENHSLLKNFEEIARKQYEVGMGKLSDILRAQTELSSLSSDSIGLEQTRVSAQAMVNALRNKPVQEAIPPIPEIQPSLLDLTLEQISPLAETNRPELKSMKLATAMQQAELQAAKKEYYPDFMVRGAYKQMMDVPDDWELMVGMTVPIAPWSLKKYSAESRSAQAKVSQSTYDFSTMRNMISFQVLDALSKMQSSQAQIRIVRGTIIPQAEQSLQATVAAYQTGKQDFMTLVDTERMLLDAKRDYHMAVMRLLAARAQLERAVGLSIGEIDQSFTGSQQ